MMDKKVLRSIRLETELDEWLKKKAKAGDRSLNAEINRTLRKEKESEEGEEPEQPKP